MGKKLPNKTLIEGSKVWIPVADQRWAEGTILMVMGEDSDAGVMALIVFATMPGKKKLHTKRQLQELRPRDPEQEGRDRPQSGLQLPPGVR